MWYEISPRAKHLLIVKCQREDLTSTDYRHDIFLAVQFKLGVYAEVMFQRKGSFIGQTSTYDPEWCTTWDNVALLTKAQVKAVCITHTDNRHLISSKQIIAKPTAPLLSQCVKCQAGNTQNGETVLPITNLVADSESGSTYSYSSFLVS